MTIQICPKCQKQSHNTIECCHCGIIFIKYTEVRDRRLLEINNKWQCRHYSDAKKLCEKLFLIYPETRVEDINLVKMIIDEEENLVKMQLEEKNNKKKYNEARLYFKKNDYDNAELILRNIVTKNDSIKNDVESLINEIINIQNKFKSVNDSKNYLDAAKESVQKGNIIAARKYLQKVNHQSLKLSVKKLEQEVENIKNKLLNESISLIKKKEYDLSEQKFANLVDMFPETKEETKGYTTFLMERNKIKQNIFTAADTAKKEGRLFDSKIIYFFLGMQFPELLRTIQPIVHEIGPSAIVCLADLNTNGIVDVGALGIDVNGDATIDVLSAAIDINEDGIADVVVVDTNGDGVADVVATSADTSGEGVADFISSFFG